MAQNVARSAPSDWLPGSMAERTLIGDGFDYSFEADRRRIRPIRTYRNPVFLALQYKNLLETPKIGSQANLARKVGVSPDRVNQMLRLFKLPSEI
jgi:hypothetical protein